MAVLGLGIDVAQIDRLEEAHGRRGQRLLERVFTEGERAYCSRRTFPWPHYAGRFAVKEAVMKVLGTGWARGVRWVDIEVRRSPGGPPSVALHGRTAEIAAERGIASIHVAITHDAGIAVAVAVAEG
jgi:holo-[acyl-carrier protein] synthase